MELTNQISDYVKIISWLFNKNIHDFSLVDKICDLIPACIYWKSQTGIYLGRNLFSAQQMVACKLESKVSKNFVVGKNDYDLFSKEDARNFVHNDNELIQENNLSYSFSESLLLPSGQVYQHISTKNVLLNKYDDPIIFGCTINTDDSFFYHNLSQEIHSHKLAVTFNNFLFSPNINVLLKLIKYLQYSAVHFYSQTELKKLLLLSDRELACVLMLVRGFSAKKMAELLQISNRTAEVFLDRVKQKLEIHCKFKLTDWFWENIQFLQNLYISHS